MRLNLTIDDKLHFTADFRDTDGANGPLRPAFEATFEGLGAGESVRLACGEDGLLALADGSKGAVDVAAPPRFAIPGGVAELLDEDGGFTLSTDGDVPLMLRQNGDEVVLVLGDRTRRAPGGPVGPKMNGKLRRVAQPNPV